MTALGHDGTTAISWLHFGKQPGQVRYHKLRALRQLPLCEAFFSSTLELNPVGSDDFGKKNWIKPEDISVYITPTGSCFHQLYCQFVNPHRARISDLQVAYSGGYGACPRCTSDALYLYLSDVRFTSVPKSIPANTEANVADLEAEAMADNFAFASFLAKIFEHGPLTEPDFWKVFEWLDEKKLSFHYNPLLKSCHSLCESVSGYVSLSVDQLAFMNRAFEQWIDVLKPIQNASPIASSIVQAGIARKVDGDTLNLSFTLKEAEFSTIHEFAALLVPIMEDDELDRNEILKVHAWLTKNRQICIASKFLGFFFYTWQAALADGKITPDELKSLKFTCKQVIRASNTIRAQQVREALEGLHGSSEGHSSAQIGTQ